MAHADAAEWGTALISECRRRIIGKCAPRIEQCLRELTEEEIWARPNGAMASAGNLVLHLCGNARQWVCSELGGAADTRDRASEFAEGMRLPRQALMDLVSATMQDVERTLADLDPGTLLETRSPQGQKETGLSILVNTIEHFGYHTGQITLHVKLAKGIELNYGPGPGLS